MATLQSPGIGSGLDIESLVTKLVAAERTPLAAQITRRESRATMHVSALATLKGALSAFKTALDPLKTEAAFAPRKATSGDDKIFTTSATASAATGAYDVEVVALASAHQLASAAFPAGSAAVVGTGTLAITHGAITFNVTVGPTNNTLAGIRDAINDAVDNPGVQATLINEVGGSRLVLTSEKTGDDFAIRVTQSGGDGGLAPLVYNPGVTTNLTELKQALDAHIRIATFDHYSPTNTVSEAIEGITLNLLDDSAGDTVRLDVSHDTSLLKERVKKFVTEYNTLYATFGKLRSYSPSSQQAGPLFGDAMLRGIESEISTDLVNPVSGLAGDYTSLASIGITRKADGTLDLNDTKLTKALEANRGAVAAIFGKEDVGVAARLYEHLETRLETGEALDTRDQGLQRALKTIKNDKEVLDARMAKVEANYRKQFTALDKMLANMTSTANFLSSQLANLPKPGGNN
jgi:flagellar hook-associated protein 2